MIAFDLKCRASHVFEAWFGSSADYEDQKQRGLISCPVCGDTHITKAIMAPNVARKGNQAAPQTPAQPANTLVEPAQTPAPASATMPVPAPSMMPSPKLSKQETEKLMTAVKEIREQVEKTCDYVGEDFAEEARKIHYGETEERGIFGETTMEEAAELMEEGVTIAPLPFTKRSDQFDA